MFKKSLIISSITMISLLLVTPLLQASDSLSSVRNNDYGKVKELDENKFQGLQNRLNNVDMDKAIKDEKPIDRMNRVNELIEQKRNRHKNRRKSDTKRK